MFLFLDILATQQPPFSHDHEALPDLSSQWAQFCHTAPHCPSLPLAHWPEPRRVPVCSSISNRKAGCWHPFWSLEILFDGILQCFQAGILVFLNMIFNLFLEKREEGRRREFPPASSPPNRPQKQHWAGLKRGDKNSVQVSRLSNRNPTASAIAAACQNMHQQEAAHRSCSPPYGLQF